MPWSSSYIAQSIQRLERDVEKTNLLLNSGTLEDWEKEYVISIKSCLSSKIGVLHKALDITKFRDILKQCVTCEDDY